MRPKATPEGGDGSVCNSLHELQHAAPSGYYMGYDWSGVLHVSASETSPGQGARFLFSGGFLGCGAYVVAPLVARFIIHPSFTPPPSGERDGRPRRVLLETKLLGTGRPPLGPG